MVHPNVPAILVTPICPHSISFRPIIIPSTAELRVCCSFRCRPSLTRAQIHVPETSRNTAWVSMDGRNRQKIPIGGSILITGEFSTLLPLPADRISVAVARADYQ